MPFAQVVDITQVEELFDVSSVSRWDPLFAVLAIVAGVIVGRVVRIAIRRYGKRTGLAPNLIDLFGTIGLWSIVSLSVLIALSLVGFNAAPIWLMVLFVGVLFVVSGKVLLENFGAGVTLQARTPFVPGDEIETEDVIGQVQQVNSRVVVIDTIDGRRVSVPNLSVLRAPIVNYTQHEHRMTTLNVGVEYGTDLEEASSVLERGLRAAEGVLDEPPPTAQVVSFDRSSIRIAARFWHLPSILDERATTHAAALSLTNELRKVGIRIAFPQLTLWHGATDEPEQDPTAPNT
ncbi:MAG: mechanosensitive ion channel [Proteobacteria bacterium]|nr:mechanosensitive ion channel [Pseudomonadota bacterium]